MSVMFNFKLMFCVTIVVLTLVDVLCFMTFYALFILTLEICFHSPNLFCPLDLKHGTMIKIWSLKKENDAKKLYIFAETCLYKACGSLSFLPSLLLHDLWGRGQVSYGKYISHIISNIGSYYKSTILIHI
jgi:hypothetical protein